MDYGNWFEQEFRELEGDLEFQVEGVIIELTGKICEVMNHRNISRADLAKELGCSKANITKILNGKPNMTLKTIVAIAQALGCNLSIEMQDKRASDNYRKEEKI